MSSSRVEYAHKAPVGDGGNVPPEDAEENELAIGRELRILSSYGDGEDDDGL